MMLLSTCAATLMHDSMCHVRMIGHTSSSTVRFKVQRVKLLQASESRSSASRLQRELRCLQGALQLASHLRSVVHPASSGRICAVMHDNADELVSTRLDWVDLQDGCGSGLHRHGAQNVAAAAVASDAAAHHGRSRP